MEVHWTVSQYAEFRYHIDREKLKFEKAAKTYAAFLQQTEKEQELRHEKDAKRIEKEQKRHAEIKKSLEDKQAKFEKMNLKREKIREQKRTMVKEHAREMNALGKTLQDKMRASTARRRFHSSAHSLDRKSLEGVVRSHTASMSPTRLHSNEDDIDSQLRKIEERFGTHAKRLEESREERMRKTRDHLEKINRTCELMQETRLEMEDQLLQKAFEKVHALQSKRNAKQSFFQSISQKARSSMEKREAKLQKQLQEVAKIAQEKISHTKQKQHEKEMALKEMVKNMKKELLRKTEQKTLRKMDQQENYMRETMLLEQLKQKVLDKHQHASDVVEAMEMQKKELMTVKLRNDMKLKRLREEGKQEVRLKEKKAQTSPKKEETTTSV